MRDFIKKSNFSELKAKYICHFCGACVAVCSAKCLSSNIPVSNKKEKNSLG
jgi:NAD-dependent dihydropyrimidine dehydrogenase PreA subunit